MLIASAYHLKYRFGVVETALAWLTDYLKGRTQRVVLDGTHGHIESDAAILKYGVPLGSVLGPILFTLYISPLVIYAGIMELTTIIMLMTSNYI